MTDGFRVRPTAKTLPFGERRLQASADRTESRSRGPENSGSLMSGQCVRSRRRNICIAASTKLDR